MGKVAPEPLVSQRTHSGRSYWVRNILASARENADAADTGLTAKGVPKSPPAKKRFVEPYRLSDEQRVAMLAPLADRGIGDPESRDLFAAALAYDLATCYELTVANPERAAVQAPDEAAAQPTAQVPAKSQPSKAAPKTVRTVPLDPALAELAEAARALAARLDALGADARKGLLQGLREGDRFHRGYGDDYLAALRGELLRVALSTDAAGEDEASSSAQPAPPLKRPEALKPSPAARQFIARAAGAFEECFDQAPTAQVGGPFAAMLKALVAVTGVRIPTDARNLAEMLRRA
jgi:hypothetical protein